MACSRVGKKRNDFNSKNIWGGAESSRWEEQIEGRDFQSSGKIKAVFEFDYYFEKGEDFRWEEQIMGRGLS